MTTKYTADLGFDTLTISADLSQASAPISYLGPDGEHVSTPHQTADALHDLRAAFRLVVEHLGSDYYADPDDDRDDDEILDELLDGIEIEASEEDESTVEVSCYVQSGSLHHYQSGEYLREATAEEECESIEQAECDGGAGVITATVLASLLDD